jgi:hypothetical protein
MGLPSEVRQKIKDYNEHIYETRKLYMEILNYLDDEYHMDISESLYDWDGKLEIMDMNKTIQVDKLDKILEAIDNLYNETGEMPDYKDVIKRLDTVSGLSSYSLVCRCDSNIDSINE